MAQEESRKSGFSSDSQKIRSWVFRIGGLLILASLATWGWFAWRSQQAAAVRDQALKLIRQGKFPEAEPLLKKAHERNHADLEVVRSLATGYLEADQMVEGETFLAQWCQLEANQKEPHGRRMEVLQQLGKLPEAIEEGKQLLALEPHNSGLHQQVTYLLLLSGRYAEAEQNCRILLEGQPDHPPLLYYLAEAYYWQGKTKEAREVLEKLLAAQKDMPFALMLRGQLYADEGQPDKAIPLLQKVLTQDPNSTASHYLLAICLNRTGQKAAADQELAELRRLEDADRLLRDMRLQPDNVDLQVQAAGALLKAGRKKEGLGLLQKILRRQPGNEAALKLMAGNYHDKN